LGLDWAEIAVHIACQKAEERGLSARFEVADTTEWKPQEQFDLVISTYALPGGEGTRKVLQTALEALAPGGTLIIAEWDRSMASVWGFDESELPTPDEIVDLLPGLEIQKAGVLHIEDMFGEKDLRASAGRGANIAFVRAVKPRN
jgi:SAM-dependent methyltransferase